MERAHIFIGGTVFLLIATLGIVLGAIHLTSSRPEATQEATYATFSSPQNVFSSLQRPAHEQPTTLTNTTATAPTSLEQQQALQTIIAQWEARPGSSDARAVRTQQTFVDTRTPEEIEQQEISNLFNDLIGTKITDKLAQQGQQNTNSQDAIWLGTYTNTTGTQVGSSESATQLTLRTYGNELGAVLKSFQLAQGDQTRLLENFLDDRTNTRNLKRLTDAYMKLALDIQNIQSPNLLATTHVGLVDSYTQVGELLWNITLANTDEELVERMLIYNKASEAVAKHHVSLVTVFKAHGVVFQPHEPGSIFSFNPQGQSSL